MSNEPIESTDASLVPHIVLVKAERCLSLVVDVAFGPGIAGNGILAAPTGVRTPPSSSGTARAPGLVPPTTQPGIVVVPRHLATLEHVRTRYTQPDGSSGSWRDL